MSRSKWCARCHWQFISAARMLTWDGGCGVCVRSDTLPEFCEDCAKRELELAALHENMRRLEEWARIEGTRRKIAEALVKEIDTQNPDSRARHHHVRWAFVWEMTGDHRELRKLVEGLMPLWKNQVAVSDPVMGKTAQALQAGRIRTN